MRSLLMVLFLSGVLFAADVDFSGTWVLNRDKSEFPEMQQGRDGRRGPRGPRGFAAAKMTITQKKNKMVVERSFTGRDGEEQTMETEFNLRGKVTKEKGRRGTTEHTAKLDGDVLNVESVRFMSRGDMDFEIVTNQKWQLVDDGKGLIIESITETPMGEMKNKAYYEKQE